MQQAAEPALKQANGVPNIIMFDDGQCFLTSRYGPSAPAIWRNNATDFTTNRAIEWTIWAIDAVVMRNRAVSLDGKGFVAPRFKQLVEINVAVERRNESSRYAN